MKSILSDGHSSRLYSELVDKKQLALRIFSSYPKSFDPNLFYFYAICGAGVEENTLEKAIYDELDKIKEKGVEEKELQKIKNQKLTGFYHSMETINARSNNLGTYELYFGDYKKLYTAPEEYSKVTSEDIKRVAKKATGNSRRKEKERS